jgi:hypothetical protein
MKSKQVLSIDQMKHLRELGLDTSDASMCWCYALSYKNAKWELEIYEDVINQKRDSTFWEIIPTYTLQDILDKLPKEIKTSTDTYWLTVSIYTNMWYICYSMSDEFDYYKEFSSVSLMDCAYDMLCCCIENEYILKEGKQ